MVKFLLDLGADPNICDPNGKSPLQRNIEGNGSLEIFGLLINKGAKIKQLNKEQKEKALLLACGYKGNVPNLEVVKHLLNEDVNPNFFKEGTFPLKDGEGTSPLHEAVQGGSIEIVKLLLEKKVDINKRDTNNRASPFALACGYPDPKKANPEIAKLLLDHGANKNFYTIEELTALEFAEKNNLTEIIEILKNYKTSKN